MSRRIDMKEPEARIPKREQAVSKLSMYMGLMGGLLVLLGGIAQNYGQSQPSPGFIGGFGQGVTVTLPFFFVFLAVKIMTMQDEYARQLQFHSGWIAFTATMLFSGLMLALEPILQFQTPNWAYLGVGMLSFGVATLILGWRDRRTN